MDFDPRFTDAYAKLDDVRDTNYHLARRPSDTDSLPNIYKGIPRGVPNSSNKMPRQRCRLCAFRCFISLLFLINVFTILLSGFNLANTMEVGMITGPLFGESVPALALAPSASIIDELREEIEHLRQNLSHYNMEVLKISACLALVEMPPPTPTPSINTTATPSINTTPTPSINTNTTPPSMGSANSPQSPTSTNSTASIHIYENCTTNRVGICEVDLTLEDPNPRFAVCSTAPYSIESVEESEEKYVAGIYCSTVGEVQLMPVTSSLNFINGMWSCICHGIEIPNEISEELRPFQCGMYVTFCPREVQIPVT